MSEVHQAIVFAAATIGLPTAALSGNSANSGFYVAPAVVAVDHHFVIEETAGATVANRKAQDRQMNAGSTNEGTLNLVVFFPLWPVERNQIIREHQLSDGRLILWATETGQLLAELVFEHDTLVHPNDRAWSCPIEAEPGAGMIIFVTWQSRLRIH
jgi:hypothetical protein